MSTTAQLRENSHRGFEGLKAALCLGSTEVKFNVASGMQVCLRPNGIGSRNTGKERDAETGLDFFLARYYSGPQGRFLSVDPENAGASSGDPQSWNAYAYSRNNPLAYLDPDGKRYRIWSTDDAGNADGWASNADLSDAEFYQGYWLNKHVDKICGNTSLGVLFYSNHYWRYEYYVDYEDEGVRDNSFEIGLSIPSFSLFKNGFKLLGKIFEKEAIEETAKIAGNLMVSRPQWASNPGGFVNWMKQLQKEGLKLTKAEADDVIAEAKRLGVEVRIDPPHAGTAWDVPHLNIGRNGQAHVKIPEGYTNPSAK